MGNNSADIQMTNKTSSSDDPPDKVITVVDPAQTKKGDSDSGSRPPTPPKRDYKNQEESMVSEPVEARRSKFGYFPRPEVIYKPDNTEGCMGCLKFVFVSINTIIWLFGAALTGIGIWMKVDKDFWKLQTGTEMVEFSNAASVLIAAGVIVMVIAVIGCYGACAMSFCMLVVYSIIIVILLLLQIAIMALVWTATKNKDVNEQLKEHTRKAMQEMSRDEKMLEFLNLLQSKLKCCGIDGPEDYPSGVPHSCNDPDTGSAFKRGCLTPVMEYFDSMANIVGGVAIAEFLFLLAALVLTCVLACGIKNAASNAFI